MFMEADVSHVPKTTEFEISGLGGEVKTSFYNHNHHHHHTLSLPTSQRRDKVW
jgi:hypothetical protein